MFSADLPQSGLEDGDPVSSGVCCLAVVHSFLSSDTHPALASSMRVEPSSNTAAQTAIINAFCKMQSATARDVIECSKPEAQSMRLTVATDLEPQKTCLVQAEIRRDQAIKTRDIASKLVETTRSELRILEDLATTRITGVINQLKGGLTPERESRRNSGIGVNGQASTPSFEQTLQRTRIEGVEMAYTAIRKEVAHRARLVEEAERDPSNAASALGKADTRLVRVKQAARLKEALGNVESG